MQKYVPLVKQNVMELEVFILGGQRIDQKRKKGSGWWRGRRKRIEKGISTLASAFLLSSRLDSAVKRCSSEVLVSSGAAW